MSPTAWQPTTAEIEAILDEMRPILAELARRDRERLRAAVLQRCEVRSPAPVTARRPARTAVAR